jgi:hypothetical protein
MGVIGVDKGGQDTMPSKEPFVMREYGYRAVHVSICHLDNDSRTVELHPTLVLCISRVSRCPRGVPLVQLDRDAKIQRIPKGITWNRTCASGLSR